MNKKNGKEKFNIITNRMYFEVKNLIKRTRDNDWLLGKIDKLIVKAKHLSYGRRSFTKSKLKRIKDEELWGVRLRELEELRNKLDSGKESTRVFRAWTSLKENGHNEEDNINRILNDNDEWLESKQEIIDYVLDYNVATLGKNIKVNDMTNEQKDVIINKTIKKLMESQDWERTITWPVFAFIVNKVNLFVTIKSTLMHVY